MFSHVIKKACSEINQHLDEIISFLTRTDDGLSVSDADIYKDESSAVHYCDVAGARKHLSLHGISNN